MSDIVERLRESVRACRALDRSALLAEAADEIERLRLTEAEREAIVLAIECLHDQPHTAMHQTVLRSARDLRGLLDRT